MVHRLDHLSQYVSAIGKLAAVLAERRAKRLAIWVVQSRADGLDRHIDTPQRTNQPCLADLGWLIAPVRCAGRLRRAAAGQVRHNAAAR